MDTVWFFLLMLVTILGGFGIGWHTRGEQEMMKKNAVVRYQFTCSRCDFYVRSDNREQSVQAGVKHMQDDHGWVPRA